MKKRLISLLVIASMIIVMVCGCGKAEKQDPPKDTNGIGGKLVIWEHTPSMETPLKAVIDGFKKKYPDVEIEYQIKTSDQYYNLLATAIQAGETPDLFWTNGTATENLGAYVKSDVVLDLTDKVDLSIFDKDVFELITIDGKIYSTPTAELGGRAVFYNKDIFKELGLSVPKTFSEFEALLPVIQKAGYLPISFAGSDSWTILFQFDPVLNAMHPDWAREFVEGKQVKINDSRVIDAYKKMLEWGDLGYYGPGFTGVGSGATLAFSTGKAAMYIDGTWNVKTIRENNPDLNFGAFQIPDANGVRSFCATSSVGYSVAKATKNLDAALAFENYFASLEGQTLWINSLGAIPRLKEIVSEDSVINELKDFDVITKDFYTILGAEAAEGKDPRTVWEEDQVKVMSKGLTPEEFTDELAELTVPGK